MEKQMTFDEQLKLLEANVSKIENEVLSLETTLALYEESVKIIKQLEKTLLEAEAKIKEIK